MPRTLAKTAKVRVVIDGVTLQTTAGNLRTGSISTCLHNAWTAFELERRARPISGYGSTFWDVHMQRNVNIQFDLY